MEIPILHTERLLLRPFRADDFEAYAEMNANPDVMRYFFMLGMAELMVQMMQGADALAGGEPKRVMSTFLINSISYFHRNYLDICRP